MSEKCFICLNNTKNKICSMCKCSAHPACWGSYLKNTTNVVTFVYPNYCSIMSPYTTRCPICRKNIGNVKSLTRSDTRNGRGQALILTIRNMLFQIEMETNSKEKQEIAVRMFNIIVNNNILLFENETLATAIKEKLKTLYTINNWTPANLYHLRLFGEQII